MSFCNFAYVGSRIGIMVADIIDNTAFALEMDVLYIPNEYWSNLVLTIKMAEYMFIQTKKELIITDRQNDNISFNRRKL